MELIEYISVINQSLLFKHYSRKELLNFFQTIDYKICQYNKNSIVFMENEICTTLNIILWGSIQIQKIDTSGKTLTIAEFEKGDTVGENLLFGGRNTFPMTGLAKSKTVILQISKDVVLDLCQNDSLFLTQLLRVICDKTVTLTGKLKEVTLKNIRQQICEQILEVYRIQDNLKIQLNITKKEWAEKLGIQRPSLSRELMKMKKEGLIDYDRSTILIKNLEKIKRYI